MRAPPHKVAVLFRYGLREHLDFLPALPRILHELNDQEVEVHHFGFRGGGDLPEDLVPLVTVHGGLFHVRRESEWDKHFKAVLWLMGLPFLGLKLQRQGFLTVFVDETLPLSAFLLRLSYRGKLMFTVHDFFLEVYGEPLRVLRGLGRRVQALDLKEWRKLDRVFTRVEAAKKALVEKGLEPEKISVVPDAVDLTLFHPLKDPNQRKEFRETWGISTEDVVVVHHGIMHLNKGNRLLVEALARVRDRLPQVKLLFIGDGPEMKELRHAIEELDLKDRVILTGWLPGLRDISKALQASDIGVVMRKGLPGDHFHVTSTLVHNLACGLPVLSVRLDGICERIQDGKQGLFFDPECGEEFDQKLIQLVEHPEMRLKMGRLARRKAEESFDPKRIAGDYVKGLCG